MLTSSICEIELRDPDGLALPPHPPGAHVSLDTPAGQRRSYSITNPAAEADRYVIAVHRQPEGRGGSVSVVDDTEIGSLLTVSAATSAFELVEAPGYLLLAGGVGITPIRSMLHHILGQGRARVRLVYLTRTLEETAYAEELDRPGLVDVVVLHHSAVAGRADLWPWLAEPDDETHVYCCGSTALMDDVRALTMHWRPSHIHFEDFAGVDALGGTSAPFALTWEPTGGQIDVASDETALEALRRNGVRTPSSCESGTCGTCRLRLVAGEAEHRDLVLTPPERASFVMPCVSRAVGEAITVAPL